MLSTLNQMYTRLDLPIKPLFIDYLVQVSFWLKLVIVNITTLQL